MRPVKQADCHPERRHLALGLCSRCYHKRLYHLPLGVRSKPAKCHPDRKARTREGLCSSCYDRSWKARNSDKVSARKREWNWKNRDYVKERRLIKRLRDLYGMSLDEYEAKILEQCGVCAICKTNIIKAVDHCHRTGKVRGLLCSNCNTGIARAHDNTHILEECVEYLLRTSI